MLQLHLHDAGANGGLQYCVGAFRGTDGSNPVPSSGESSANRTSSHHAAQERCMEGAEPVTTQIVFWTARCLRFGLEGDSEKSGWPQRRHDDPWWLDQARRVGEQRSGL